MVGLRPSNLVRPRPDNTSGLTGSEGNLLEQDGAKAVFRGGVNSENGDFDVFQHDLVNDGPKVIPLDNVGGASLVNAGLVSLGDSGDSAFDTDPGANPTDASRPFTVRVEDLAADADVMDPAPEDILTSRTPQPVDGVETGRLAVGIFSDRGRVVIEHGGLDVGENLVNASLNVQSGSTDAIQIRGPDGTLRDPDDSPAIDTLRATIEAIRDSKTSYEEDQATGGSLYVDGTPIISLDTRASSVLDVSLDGTDADVSYELQTRPEAGADWFDWEVYDGSDGTGTDRIRDTVRIGSRYVRLVVSDQSANDDATATVALQTSG